MSPAGRGRLAEPRNPAVARPARSAPNNTRPVGLFGVDHPVGGQPRPSVITKGGRGGYCLPHIVGTQPSD
jgi:hypothetical protein